MFHATFKIKDKSELWFITKKREEEITRQECADSLTEKRIEECSEGEKVEIVWAADVENLTPVEGEEEIKKMFKEVDNSLKLFL